MAGPTTVANLQANLTLNTDGFSSGVNNASGATENLTTSILKAEAVKGVLSAVASFAEKVADVVKQSVGNFAEYEQLVGGVETLFGDSAGVVQDYAKNAYKTAGLSANEYMKQATSFSASLLQSLGGDTEQAAHIADMAITDMADNANKMGSDISSIQNAYQGFAKQNYTMLDNLKLGYGGTKEEMERLLADAEKLSGQKYDISNLNDVFEAIHVVQTELHISGISAEEAAEAIASGAMTEEEAFEAMGTTAKEAATTIEGSTASMKASWDNLLTSMVTGGDSLDESVNAFVESSTTYLDNLLPKVTDAMNGFGDLVEKIAPIIAERLPKLVEDLLPGFLDAVVSILDGIIAALPGLLTALTNSIPLVTDALVTLVPQVVSFILEGIPLIVDAGAQLLQSLFNSFAESANSPEFDLTSVVMDMIDKLVDIITNFDYANLVTSAASIVVALANGITGAIGKITEKLPEIITALVAWLTNPANLEALGTSAITIFGEIVSDIPEILTSLAEGLAGIVTGIAQYFTDNGDQILDGLKNAFNNMGAKFIEVWEEKIKPAFDTLGDKIRGWLEQFEWGQAVLEFLGKLKEGISNAWDSIKDAFTGEDGFFGKVKSWLKSLDLLEAAKSIVESLKNGINNAWEGIKTWFSDKVKGLFDGINIDLSGLKFWEKWGKGKDKENGSETGTEEGEELGSIDMPENMVTLDYNQLTPISGDVIESYQNFAAAIRDINAAMTGQSPDDMVSGMPAVGAGAEEGPVGLIGALEKIPEKMQQIMDTAKALADYLTGDFIAAINTVKKAMAIVEVNDAGEANASGGNTLYTALGAVQGVLESILTLSQSIANFWKGDFQEAVKELKKASEIAQECCSNMATSAASAKEEFAGLAGAIRDVVAAIEELNGVGIPDLGGGGGGGGGKAAGGPVSGGTTYLVGEKGPELFTPNRSGYIIPNDDLFTASGGDTNITICFNGDVIGDEESISEYVTQATRRAIQEEVYAGI